MHGRQRVERSPEEEAKKQKEREAKNKAYQYAMSKIFDKRSKGELDGEMLHVTGQVLSSNPDIHTLWNIRKETLAKFKEANQQDFTDNLFPKELDFSEVCLKANPKSYGAWEHRRWLMKETNFHKVADELKLCSKYLEYDDRNFHTWDYRRFLLDNSSIVTLQDELKFTTEKISNNFSNFSSWHLRSKILPQLEGDFLERELELIRNAAFTDPKDQSAWLYHMWLLKSRLPKDPAKLSLVKLVKHHLLIRFTGSVLAPTPEQLTLEGLNCSWTNPLGSTRSKLWMIKVEGQEPLGEQGLMSLRGSYIKDFFGTELKTVYPGEVLKKFIPYFDEETKPKDKIFETLLREELAWVEELKELEPDIKWPVYAAINLMRMINFLEFKSKILQYLATLNTIDPKRSNYYNDLRSKFVMESFLIDYGASDSDSPVDLSDLELTALYYPERLCEAETVNCSSNKLKNGTSLAYLISCKSLNVQNNQILINNSFVQLTKRLPNLTSLRCSDNPDFCLEVFSDQLPKSVHVS